MNLKETLPREAPQERRSVLLLCKSVIYCKRSRKKEHNPLELRHSYRLLQVILRELKELQNLPQGTPFSLESLGLPPDIAAMYDPLNKLQAALSAETEQEREAAFAENDVSRASLSNYLSTRQDDIIQTKKEQLKLSAKTDEIAREQEQGISNP